MGQRKSDTCAALIVLALGATLAWLPVRAEAQRTVYLDGTNGTLAGALGAGGINLNGRVVITTSSSFAEQINLTGLNGVVIIEGAPGVAASIEAVVGNDAGNFTRLAGAGVTVDAADADHAVILRNLTIRNFSVGLWVKNRAHVVCENCRFDSNLSSNVLAQDNATLTITGSSVLAAGKRFTPSRNTPSPGDGFTFLGHAGGTIANTTISMNTGAGVRNNSSSKINLAASNTFSDNGVDTTTLGSLAGGVNRPPF